MLTALADKEGQINGVGQRIDEQTLRDIKNGLLILKSVDGDSEVWHLTTTKTLLPLVIKL